MALQLRRGTAAEISTIIPDLGEPLYATDTKELFVGDGITSGGNKVSSNQQNLSIGTITEGGQNVTVLSDDLNGKIRLANSVNSSSVTVSSSGTAIVGNLIFNGTTITAYNDLRGYTGSAGTNGYTGSAGAAGSQGYTGSAGSDANINSTGTYTMGTLYIGDIRHIDEANNNRSVLTSNQSITYVKGPYAVSLEANNQTIAVAYAQTDLSAGRFELEYPLVFADGTTQTTAMIIGYTGSTGAGYVGSKGDTGYTGSQGSTGYTGSQGNQGFTGSQGDIGYVGSQGDVGYIGSKGDQGDPGLGFTIAKVYSSVAALEADTSPTGIVAGQFALIETGDVEDPENSRLYVWDGSVYTYTSDLSGAQGITGPAGYTGSQGDIGYVGSQGDIGYTGSQGDVGFTGSQGDIGYTGSQGDVGYTGSQGDIGYVGSQGDAGSAGSQGYTGSQGATGYTGSAGSSGDTSVYARNALPSGVQGMIITVSDSGTDANAPAGNWAPAYWDDDASEWVYIGNSNSVTAI